MAEPSSRNQIRAGSLRIVDPDGQPYDSAWLGMADDVDGSDQWLRVGGIGQRLSLDAARVRTSGRLEVAGDLHVTGTHNLLDVLTTTLIVQNAGVDQAGGWRIDFPGRFARVYAGYAVLQGFSVFGASVAPKMRPPAAHMNEVNVIPQHVVVEVFEVAIDYVSGIAYTSESYGPNEGDNRTLFTVVVLGQPV